MQTVLITGISRGIGKALANKFLNEGYKVFGTSTSGSVDFAHESLEIFSLDLALSESIAACAARLAGTGEEFDIVINNAGVLLDEEEKTLIPNLLRATLEVNLIGTADFSENIIPLVKEGGHILFVSSTAGSIERTGTVSARFPSQYPAYKISKAALNMYMRTLSIRLKEKNIVVSSINPGFVRTDMGGEDADISPEESADDVFKIATSRPETGQFRYKDKLLPW